MNSGGIRADVAPGGPRGEVTYEDLYTVQPFDNLVTVVTMSGAMIRQLLEEQFAVRAGRGDILQVSDGFTYRYRVDAPQGQHVDPDSIMIAGRRLDPTARYRVAAPDFVVDGGGGFRAFSLGTDRVVLMSDLDALVSYFGTHSPVSPTAPSRIVREE
jgi:5'-nucleotidase